MKYLFLFLIALPFITFSQEPVSMNEIKIAHEKLLHYTDEIIISFKEINTMNTENLELLRKLDSVSVYDETFNVHLNKVRDNLIKEDRVKLEITSLSLKIESDIHITSNLTYEMLIIDDTNIDELSKLQENCFKNMDKVTILQTINDQYSLETTARLSLIEARVEDEFNRKLRREKSKTYSF